MRSLHVSSPSVVSVCTSTLMLTPILMQAVPQSIRIVITLAWPHHPAQHCGLCEDSFANDVGHHAREAGFALPQFRRSHDGW